VAFHTGPGRGWREISNFGSADYLSLAAIGVGIPLAVLYLGTQAGAIKRDLFMNRNWTRFLLMIAAAVALIYWKPIVDTLKHTPNLLK
jgi:hypothetical protein